MTSRERLTARARALLAPRRQAAICALACALAPLSCAKCGTAEPRKDAAPEVEASASATSADATLEPAPDAAVTPPVTDAGAAPEASSGDAGPSACRLAYGPAEQPFRGPAAMVIAGNELRLVANDGGKPRIYPVALGAPPPAAARVVVPPRPASFVGMRWPPCELAGKWAYCQAAGGAVYRTTLGGTDAVAVAKSRPSTRIAAAPLGPDHAVVATIDVRRTTEGDRLQAFITLDNGETTRLSEEGAGATVVRLVPRGEQVVALYIDARTSMVPVHARPLSMRGSELALADDAVVFVAGPPERGVDFGVAGSQGSLFALLPIAHETRDFGMAAIPIPERPKEDVQPVWSMYPNGLDPAPLAGTVQASEGSYVARVRPRESMPGALRVLELGRLEGSGAFTSLGILTTGKPITDVSLITDRYGSVWVLYGDTTATWLERRVCP